MDEREQLEKVLRSGKATLRRYALERMSSLGVYPDLGLIKELCNDPDAEVRSLASRALRVLTRRRAFSSTSGGERGIEGGGTSTAGNDFGASSAGAASTPSSARALTGATSLSGACNCPGYGDGEHPATETRCEDSLTSPKFRVHEVKIAALEVLKPCIDRLFHIASTERDIEVARQAVTAIGRLGDWESVDGLIGLLDDPQLCAEAALALSTIGDLRAVTPIIEAIHRTGGNDSKSVILALGGFQTRDTMAQLIGFLSDSDVEVRAQSALTLRNFVDREEVRDALYSVFGDEHRRVVINALLALKGLDDPMTTDVLVGFWETPALDGHIKATILSALQGVSQQLDRVASILEQGLKDPDDRVRANAVDAVAGTGFSAGRRKSLLDLVRDDADNRVRGNLAIALGNDDPGASLRILEEMFKSPDKWLRSSAAYVGRLIVNHRVAEWLLSIMAVEEDEDVLRSTVASLRVHPGAFITDRLIPLLDHCNPIVRAGAVRVLASRHTARIAGELVRRYNGETSDDVRADMVSAVGELRAAEYSAFLCEVLREDNERIQANAIEALDKLGRLETVPSIVPFLHSPDNRLRANAAVALWHQGCLSVVEILGNMLRHPKTRFRLSALHAIGVIGEGLPSLGKDNRTLPLCSALLRRDTDLEFRAVGESADEALGIPCGGNVGEPEGLSGTGAEAVESSEDWGKTLDLAGISIRQIAGALELIDNGHFDDAFGATAGREDVLNSYLAGLCRLKSGRETDAADDWRLGAERGGVFFPMALDAADVLKKQGNALASFRLYLRAFRMKMHWAGFLLDLCERMLDDERILDLSSLVRELLGDLPLEKSTFHRMGVLLLGLKEYESARNLLLMAYVLNPESNHVRFNLALACYHLNLLDECRCLAEKVLDSAESGSAETERSRQLLSLLD